MTHVTRKSNGDLRESAEAVKDAVMDLASDAGSYARDRISDAKDSASAMMEQVKTKATAYNNTFVSLVRKNPYKSLAIAAAVGLTAGLLLRRRAR